MTDVANFEGHEQRECGEHRTVGPHRAWCFDCNEWCYPEAGCKGCELPVLRETAERLQQAVNGCEEAGLLLRQELEDHP